MKHILIFDIAKGKSVYCYIDELRNTIIDATLIEHKKDEYFTYNPLARQFLSLIERQTILKNRYKQLIDIVFFRICFSF